MSLIKVFVLYISSLLALKQPFCFENVPGQSSCPRMGHYTVTENIQKNIS